MILYLSLQLIVRACDGLSWNTPAGLWTFESRARGYVANWNLLMSGCRKLDRWSEVKHTTVWVTVTVSFHFEKRTRWGYVWVVSSLGSLAITTSCDRLRRCSSYSGTRKLATILCLAAAATSPLYLFLPISFASLDTRGYGIAESSWLTDTTTPDAGSAELMQKLVQVLHWELDEEFGRMLVTFRRSVVVSTRIRSWPVALCCFGIFLLDLRP